MGSHYACFRTSQHRFSAVIPGASVSWHRPLASPGSTPMDDLAGFCCLNTSCPEYGQRGGTNLVVRGHLGARGQIRILRCRTCGTRFSERKGTPLYRSHLPAEEAVAILE